jgi:hypothetical protein
MTMIQRAMQTLICLFPKIMIIFIIIKIFSRIDIFHNLMNSFNIIIKIQVIWLIRKWLILDCLEILEIYIAHNLLIKTWQNKNWKDYTLNNKVQSLHFKIKIINNWWLKVGHQMFLGMECLWDCIWISLEIFQKPNLQLYKK